LEKLDLAAHTRRQMRPGLVDITLDAYGWTGPWNQRRGFDSLVQMSAGIAAAGMRILGRERPTPLPVQALDHVAGYLMAAMALRGLTQRLQTGRGFEGRTSLARVASLLTSAAAAPLRDTWSPPAATDWCDAIEASDFGPAHRLRSPLTIGNLPLSWDRPAARLGSVAPAW
jgi:crotonobetainyl-CoA:carnitine CoA-transferase CaiB-like acyl-CoA transferase